MVVKNCANHISFLYDINFTTVFYSVLYEVTNFLWTSLDLYESDVKVYVIGIKRVAYFF